MKVRSFLLVLALATMTPSQRALAACKIARIADFQVTMAGMRALVPAKINGADAEFILDSGAFFSLMTPAGAAEYKLRVGPAPRNLRLVGIGGSADASVATVQVLTLANTPLHYVDSGRFGPAVAQFDLWISSHAEDSRKPDALNGRCWARALWRRDLKKALSDCNLAIYLRPDTASFLDSRALVEQRLGKVSKSIEDYDAALRLQPKNAWFLYSRGVTELRAGQKAQGRADIAAAMGPQPDIVQIGREPGVTP